MLKFPSGTPLWVTAVLLSAPVVAHAQAFNAKPGAWETAVTTSGMSIPPEALARIPPEQRDKVEQQLRGQTQSHKSCIRKEDLERGFLPNANANCTVEIVTKTSTKLVANTTCTTPIASKGTMSWQAKTPESVVGDIDQDIGGRRVHISIVGKWLGASCDGIPARPASGG